MIYVPEIVLKTALDLYIQYLRDDITANVADYTKSYLYKIVTLLFGDNTQITLDTYDFAAQAKKVFNQQKDDPKFLKVNYGYNMQVQKPPILCVKLGSQQPASVNALGIGMGYLGDDVDQTGEEPDDHETLAFSKSRRMASTLNFIIMSDNSNETLLLYYIFQSGLIALMDHLSLSGFENMKLSGQDLVLNDEVVPKNFYNRVIQLSFEYTTGSLDYPAGVMIKEIITKLQNVYPN